MFETILSMWLPLSVLLVAGIVTLGLAWWACLAAEDHDDFLWDGPDQ